MNRWGLVGGGGGDRPERVHEHMSLVSENLPIYYGDSSAAEFARSLKVSYSWIQCIGLNPL